MAPLLLTARFAATIAFAASLVVSLASPRGAAAAEPAPHFMVVDLHVDVPWQVHGKGRSPKLTEGQARIEALQKGGYGGVVLPIYISDKIKGGPKIDDAEAIYRAAVSIVEASSIFLPLRSRVAEPDRITTFLAIEGAGAFAEDITAIDRFIDRGVRLVSLAHARNNKLASAATGGGANYGLTDLGKQFAARIYEKGALVDVSHLSDAGFRDLVPIAEAHGAPIVATHSNARALCDVPRNLTDEQLRTIGRTGGVAGLNFHSLFVKADGAVTLADVVAQAEHMIAVAGIDHVAIGSDFDGDIKPAEGMEDASHLPALARELSKRGRKDDEILKLFSLNALRVLGWRPSPPRGLRSAEPSSAPEPPPKTNEPKAP
ncbi:dipeptidase [Polyangium jinanense]|nr:membrane dipeptidase [Polyangium jinanense]